MPCTLLQTDELGEKSHAYLASMQKIAMAMGACTLLAANVQAQLQASISGFRFGGPGNERIVDAVSDEQGNSYILGTFSETFVLGTDTLDWINGNTFLAKLGPDEEWLWAHELPVNHALALAIHPEGGLVVFSGAITKLNADATEVEWIAEPDVYPFAFLPPAEVVVDDQGNIYCSVMVNSSNLIWDGITTPFTGDIGTFVGKLGADHQLLWAHQFGAFGSGGCWSYETIGNSLLLDGDDGVWLSGTFGGTQSLFDGTTLYSGDGTCTLTPFVAHLSPAGAIDWLVSDDPGSGGGEQTQSCLDPNGDLFLWGGTTGDSFSFGGQTTGPGLFSATIDPAGGLVSLQSAFSDPGFSSDDMLMGPDGAVLVVGQRNPEFNATAPVLWILQNDSLYDILQEEDTLDRRMSIINRTSPHTFRVFGHFGNDLFLPADTLHSIGTLDAAVLEVEFDVAQRATEAMDMNDGLHCAPVPFTSHTVLSADRPFPPGSQLRMLDAMGRTVYQRPLNSGNSVSIPRNTLPAGAYVLTISSAGAASGSIRVLVE